VLEGLTTAIIVDQERMDAVARSTVGTATDANAMLRILYSRLGQPHIGVAQRVLLQRRPGPGERCRVCHLKQCHGLATRYDKLAIIYRAAAVLNAVIAWTRHLQTTSECLSCGHRAHRKAVLARSGTTNVGAPCPWARLPSSPLAHRRPRLPRPRQRRRDRC